MEWIIILSVLLWLTFGYTAWRLRYYGLMKTWYEKFGYADNLAEKSCAKHWSKGVLLLLVCGIISLLVVLVSDDDGSLAWYFKQPKP